MANLYIVGTPIGNLEDISLRALRILGEVDFILCEDTRVTKKLLAHYKINTPTISYHQHSNKNKTDYILGLLAKGKSLALVSDAGTPGISDPGGKLVQAVVEMNAVGAGALRATPEHSARDGVGALRATPEQRLRATPEQRLRATPEQRLRATPVQIEAVPGPSAVTAALSISGIPTDKFIFMGFLPHKKGRQAFLNKIIESEFPAVVYESKHRIIKFLEELEHLNQEIIKNNKKIETEAEKISSRKKELLAQKKTPVTSIVVCRELSKMHETVYRGEIKDIIKKIKDSRSQQKGEFVVIIGK